MRKLYIFRGIPGSGKSTLAAKKAALTIEMDMFRYDADMRYEFKPNDDEPRKRHIWLLECAMRAGVKALAVCNTHTTLRSMDDAIRLGKKFMYDITVCECYGRWPNVHGVPDDVLDSMLKTFQPLNDRRAGVLGVKLEKYYKEENEDPTHS